MTENKGNFNMVLVMDCQLGLLYCLPLWDTICWIWSTYTFRLQLDEMTDISLVLLATDELDAGSTLKVQVKMVYDL